jgi:hypothetical protein
MLPAFAQISLAELKRYANVAGSGKDQELEDAIALASQDIEEEGLGGRRVVYRGPVEDDDNIMAAAALANGPSFPSIAGQPNSAGRTLVVKRVDADRGLTGGTLTVTGTVGGVAGTTEVFDLTAGDELHGLKFFTAISGLSLAGVAGSGAGDTLQIGTSPGYTELYSPSGGSEIIPLDWPIQNVVEINEDLNGVFGVTTALVAGTQYEIREPFSVRRRIARVSNLTDYAFYPGYRVVRGRMSAGYRTQAKVPPKIKGVCKELAAWYYQHSEKREFGMQNVSDGLGGRSFSGPPLLTDGMKNRLAAYLRPEFDATAERDFALEAA